MTSRLLSEFLFSVLHASFLMSNRRFFGGTTLVGAVLIACVGACASDQEHQAGPEAQRKLSQALSVKYSMNVGELRESLVMWEFRQSQYPDLKSFIVEQQLTTRSFSVKRVDAMASAASIERMLESKRKETNSTVDEFLKWSAVDGVFAFEFQFRSKYGEPESYVGIVRSSELDLSASRDTGCSEGLTLVRLPRAPSLDSADDGCNEQGCGCNQGPETCCQVQSGELGGCPNEVCGCSHGESCGCYGLANCGGGCTACACDDRPLEALKANADGFRQFYTDPEESVGYFSEDRSISDVAVGGTL